MKNSTKLFTLIFNILVFALVVTGCNNKVEENINSGAEIEPTFNLETAKTEIESANKEFKNFFTAVDSVGLSNLYTQDTKFMMTGAPSIIGRENVKSTFSAIMNSGISTLDLKTIEVWGNENYVTEEGEYKLYAGDDVADHGKYIVL